MSNKIRVTACDNELLMVAFDGSHSYQICNLKSGNYNGVDVNIDILPGQYTHGVNLDGVNNPIAGNYIVQIPPGRYELSIVGINWGGPADYNVDVNDVHIPYIPDGKITGVVWVPNNTMLNV